MFGLAAVNIHAGNRVLPACASFLRIDEVLLQQLGVDMIVVSKGGEDVLHRMSAAGNKFTWTIRDHYSGQGFTLPSDSASQDTIRNALLNFVGAENDAPKIIVKSDCARAIIGAVEELGWLSEPSLANRWPHNTYHERWHGTYKSVIRAAMCQSGILAGTWDTV